MPGCDKWLRRFAFLIRILLSFVIEGEQGQKTLKWRSSRLDLLAAAMLADVLAVSWLFGPLSLLKERESEAS